MESESTEPTNASDVPLLEDAPHDNGNQQNLTDDATESSDGSIKFDKLGPIILNSDGTMSRIPNWADMPESEKAKALRLLARRNKARKEALTEADSQS
mmetsp:Transcript_26276/g.38955  ORF Transcript_26276/g.38955 Transcript_26276/m.38955 type:complete len:98 (+) Transcript_26276:137-430(+)|eukprot:CAMPEP_0185036466 /NCGR_PEP_ID=MMETSP1103-20130426/29526_1 /TAXON_ID=36769 /ORGANISM="Paraphysomonas bandaiensis, Strain Caron Lab Isolate" /LENGTH=97 /DNA_ID=CAMNT_0027574009 /DNA_START=76 /DNA_END=369 /DNA_ORIENTATION=+